MAWGNEVMSLRKNCIHKHSAQNGDFLNFALGHFDLPNQLWGGIPGVNTYERCDHVNLVNADPSWKVPYSITFELWPNE